LWQNYNIPQRTIGYDGGIKLIGIEMYWRYAVLSFCASLAIAGFATDPARAQTRVGEAAVVKNEVVRVIGSGSNQINVGDAVLRDEVVRTGPDSATRLVMADDTNLSLSANATITLDRTVFNDEHTYRDIAIRLTTGAFRFVTGHSEKAAYKITTSLGTIGVRGTILDILVQRGKITVVLQEGASSVCTLSFQCTQLTQPGDTAIITSTGSRSTIQKTNHSPWTFAAACAATPGLCNVTDFADATPPGTPADGGDPTGMLCGR
jgi:ferric-dicitrate binding protein FerR (iron transport regulator)